MLVHFSSIELCQAKPPINQSTNDHFVIIIDLIISAMHKWRNGSVLPQVEHAATEEVTPQHRQYNLIGDLSLAPAGAPGFQLASAPLAQVWPEKFQKN